MKNGEIRKLRDENMNLESQRVSRNQQDKSVEIKNQELLLAKTEYESKIVFLEKQLEELNNTLRLLQSKFG